MRVATHALRARPGARGGDRPPWGEASWASAGSCVTLQEHTPAPHRARGVVQRVFAGRIPLPRVRAQDRAWTSAHIGGQRCLCTHPESRAGRSTIWSNSACCVSYSGPILCVEFGRGNTFRTRVDSVPLLVEVGQIRTRLGRLWAGFCRDRGHVCRFCATVGRFRANLVRTWPNLVEVGPTLAEVGRARPSLGRNRSNLGRLRAKVSDVGRTCPKFGRRCSEFGRRCNTVSQRRPVSARFRPNSA